MYWINQLKKIIKDIETVEINIDILEERKRALIKKNGPSGIKSIDFSGMPHGKGQKDISYVFNEIQNLQYELETEYMLLTDLNKTYTKYTEKLKNSHELKCKIAYKRLIENKTYKQIAADLNLSESYIRNTANKTMKEI